jgi:hypothetical protein
MGSSLFFVDKESGQVDYGPSFAIGPNLSLNDFVRSNIYHEATQVTNHKEHKAYKLPTLSLADKKINTILYFNEETLKEVHVGFSTPEGTSSQDWSDETEEKRKRYHDLFLRELCGDTCLEGRWGTIRSVFDSKMAESVIKIKYV